MTTHRKHHDRLEELRKLNAEAEAGGGAERREREHKQGKLSTGTEWTCFSTKAASKS